MDLLNDVKTLRLLRYLVSGEGVSVKINTIARDLKIHRATDKKRVDFLFDEHILTRPFYPFSYLYVEYPLLVLVKADMPRSKDVIDFLKDDSHIFAAFSCMEGPYNTFLIEYFKNQPSKILIFNIFKNEGWKKLCEFLDKPIPTQPFPHKNIGKYKRK